MKLQKGVVIIRRIRINPLRPNDVKIRRPMSPLKIKIPTKNLGRRLCAEGFNSDVNGLMEAKQTVKFKSTDLRYTNR
jgi:hypothetical protein